MKDQTTCRKDQPLRILLNMAVGIHNNRECELLISQYASRIADAGCVPILMPSIEKGDLMDAYLDLADGVLLIGGKDYHSRYFGEEPHEKCDLGRLRPGCDIAFGYKVLQRSLPVFGICAGCQLFNILTGGKLIQHLDNAPEHTNGTFHEAVVIREGHFSRIFRKEVNSTLTVNSFHHQALHEDFLGEGLCVTARAFDGTVEAVEGTGPQTIFGVQFHPERMDDLGVLFFQALAEEARAYRENSFA